ncbi:MAG: trigger factor, partial [Chloroflexi bacterium]|nr:trigger factor [Chloroflexota bacterium]
VAKARREVARKLSRQIRIPGFRPGMAPVNVVVAAIGGEQAFATEVADELGSRLYSKAIDEANIDPYGPGQLEDVKSTPTQLIVRVPLEPKVDLKDYQSVRVPYSVPTVSEEEIESQLQYIREDNAVVELVERPAQPGDLVEADIIATADGKEVLHSHRPIVLDEDRINLPGLVQAIVGMSAGEHKDATITLPDDFGDDSLRGKEATTSIDVKRVSSRQLPEINDELAQTVGSFNSLVELREDLGKRLLEYKTRNAEQQYATQVLDTFTSLSQIAYPPAYVEDRLNEMVDDLKEDVRRDEKMPWEDWLKLQGKTDEQVRQDLRPNAETRAKRGLVMREMARAEGIQVSDEEIAAEVERTSAQFGGRTEEIRRTLMRDESRRTVHNNILSNKVMQRMVQIARGEVVEPAPEPAGEVIGGPAVSEEAPAPTEPAQAS